MNKSEQNEIISKSKKPTKWETVILPHKDDIIKLFDNGASEFQVYSALGISKDAWYNAKRLHPELEEWINQARCKIVGQLKSALLKKALGFTYDEEITEIRQDQDADGNPIGKKFTYTRKLHHYSPPDSNAIYGCLKMFDVDNEKYDVQAKAIAIKKDELEMKKKLLLPDGEADKDLIKQLEGFKIEIVDASKKEGKDDKGN